MRIYRPLLDYLDWLQVQNMRVGDAVLDLGFSRHDQDVAVNILRKEGDGDVAAIVKKGEVRVTVACRLYTPALVECREPPVGNASMAARIAVIGSHRPKEKIVYGPSGRYGLTSSLVTFLRHR